MFPDFYFINTIKAIQLHKVVRFLFLTVKISPKTNQLSTQFKKKTLYGPRVLSYLFLYLPWLKYGVRLYFCFPSLP